MHRTKFILLLLLASCLVIEAQIVLGQEAASEVSGPENADEIGFPEQGGTQRDIPGVTTGIGDPSSLGGDAGVGPDAFGNWPEGGGSESDETGEDGGGGGPTCPVNEPCPPGLFDQL